MHVDVDIADCMLCHVACPCWINGMFPKGMLNLMWDCKSNARLAGALYDNRIMKMSCWMSRWNDNPAIEYILYGFAHTVFTICIFYWLELFLPSQVRMISINLLLCDK